MRTLDISLSTPLYTTFRFRFSTYTRARAGKNLGTFWLSMSPLLHVPPSRYPHQLVCRDPAAAVAQLRLPSRAALLLRSLRTRSNMPVGTRVSVDSKNLT